MKMCKYTIVQVCKFASASASSKSECVSLFQCEHATYGDRPCFCRESDVSDRIGTENRGSTMVTGNLWLVGGVLDIWLVGGGVNSQLVVHVGRQLVGLLMIAWGDQKSLGSF